MSDYSDYSTNSNSSTAVQAPSSPSHMHEMADFNSYQITGVYALKLVGDHDFIPDFEISFADYEDMPENMRRVWGCFSMHLFEGFVALEHVVAKLVEAEVDDADDDDVDADGPTVQCYKDEQAGVMTVVFQPSGSSANSAKQTVEIETTPDGKRVITVPDIWDHEFKLGDVLEFSWRGATHEHRSSMQKFKDALTDVSKSIGARMSSATSGGTAAKTTTTTTTTTSGRSSPVPMPAATVGQFGSDQAPRVIPYTSGTCRVTLKDHNMIEVAWFDGQGQEEVLYEGHRLFDRAEEMKSKKPSELKCHDDYSLEDFEYR